MNFHFDPDKSDWLYEERGIRFEDVIALIDTNEHVCVYDHPNQSKYPGQVIYEIIIDDYVFLVPAVRSKDHIFLRTIYPSRKATRKKSEESKNEKI